MNHQNFTSKVETKSTWKKLVEENEDCNWKQYNEVLGTREKLFVIVQREDLHELQKNFKTYERSIVKNCTTKTKRKLFQCKICQFWTDHKIKYFIHISKMHKDYAAEKKILPVEYMVAGKIPNIVLYKCIECAFITQRKSTFEKHLITHKQLDEVDAFCCGHCTFRSKTKANLARHIHWAHIPNVMYKCEYCEFGTKHKKYMTTHRKMVHQFDKVNQYECKICHFKTKYKTSYKNHMMIHGQSREIYSCKLCSFKTHHKGILSKNGFHMTSKHKTDKESKIYACELCPYKAKFKCYLTKHQLIHKGEDEVKMYECGICSYKTKHSSFITTHRKSHQLPDPDNMFRCEQCSYEGKSKLLLNVHMRHHRPLDELKIYKCSCCTYQSISSANVHRHELVSHTKEDTIVYHKCQICKYQAKTKDRLNTHVKQVHKHPDEVNWLKCTICAYKTTFKGNLKRHYLRHNIVEGFDQLECDKCSFITYTKTTMRFHVLTHITPKFKCSHCFYKTTKEDALLEHKKTRHKNFKLD